MSPTPRGRACIRCGRPSLPGQSRCGDHILIGKGSGWARYVRDRPERAVLYGSKEWKAVRARHLREHPGCVVCNQPATVVDHIVPRAEGGPALDPRNLQSLCKLHHGAKTLDESHRGRKRAAERRKRR